MSLTSASSFQPSSSEGISTDCWRGCVSFYLREINTAVNCGLCKADSVVNGLHLAGMNDPLLFFLGTDSEDC